MPLNFPGEEQKKYGSLSDDPLLSGVEQPATEPVVPDAYASQGFVAPEKTGSPKSNNPLLDAVRKSAMPTEAEAAAAQGVEKYDTTQTDLLANAGSKLLGILGKGSVQYAAASGVPTQGGNEIYDAATGISDSLLKGKQALQQQAQRRLAQLSGQRQEAQKSALAGLGAEREVQGMEQAAAMAPNQLQSAVMSNQLKQQEIDTNKFRQELATATNLQKNDKDSLASRQARALGKRLGLPGITANTTAAQIEPQLGIGEKIYAIDQNNQTKRDLAAERQAEAEARKTEREEKLSYDRAEKASSIVAKSRAEYNKEPLVKDFRKNTEALNLAERAASNPNTVQDLGLVYSMMRGFDPTSTVREGEFKLGQQSDGLVANLQNTIDQARGTGRLQPEQRQKIKELVSDIRKTMLSEISQLNQQHVSSVAGHPAKPDITGHLIDPATGKVGLGKEGSASQGNVVQSGGTNAAPPLMSGADFIKKAKGGQ
jgi:hypothetical protein